ncbi:MAG: hypothetical protein HC904_12370 [Blastochloris sp.]|nr:hypothetical protein [Blastochloris sp.]
MDTKGYVALFQKALTKHQIAGFVETWLGSYDKVEQVCPGPHAGGITVTLASEQEILWEKNLQFRILSGGEFTWAYLSLESRVIETSGLPFAENTMPLDVLIDLPDLVEIIDQKNDHRLDQLEAEGLI